MMIKKLVTFEDLGFVQWGVLNEAEDGVYGAIALEEAFFTPLPETMLEFIRQGNDGLLALADALESLDVPVRVQTAITMEQFAEPYIRNRAVRHMEKDRVVIFGCGTGNPFFSTDTAAALRAAEIDADAILKATMVDGVYDKDPKKYPDAKRYSTVSFSQVLAQNLNVMDMTAASLCRESKIPIVVFDLSDPENICRALCGYDIGTIVKEA